MIGGGACPGCGSRRSEFAAENPAHTLNTGHRVFVACIRNVLCLECGLVFNDPMPTERELTDLYEAMSREVAEQGAADAAAPLPIEEDQARFVAPFLGDRPQPRVLDVGCSMGGFLGVLGRRGAVAVGCEPSGFDAEVARTRYGADVRPGFFEDIDFGAERFDLVALRFVFEHVRDPIAILRRASALLRPRGAVFIEVPNLAAPFVGLDDYFSYGHLQTFTRSSLAQVCARAGFRTLAAEESTNVFASSPHPASVRALVGVGRPIQMAADVEETRRLVREYQQRRAALLGRVRAVVDGATAGYARVVVYGAGTHTAELFTACPWLKDRTMALVDGNARLQGHDFLGLPVIGPGGLRDLNPDRVVVSVRTAEAAIAAFLESQGLGARTVRLYEPHAAAA